MASHNCSISAARRLSGMTEKSADTITRSSCQPTGQRSHWPAPPRRSGAFRTVPKPLPRHVADAAAFVFRRDLPGLIEIGRRQQAVGEQEVDEITRVTAFLPDQALKQLLIVGYRAFSAQV